MEVQSANYTKLDTFLYFLYFIGKSIFITLAILFIIFVFLFFILIGDRLINSKNDNEYIPLFAGYVIVTKSMIPTIKVNDAVIVKRTEENKLNIGDIITFKSLDDRYEGLTITHRIVGTQRINNNGLVYRTKGDNNSLEDSAVVPLDSIYGKVIFRIPKFGYLQNFLKSKTGFYLFIILPLILIIYLNKKFIFSEKKERVS